MSLPAPPNGGFGKGRLVETLTQFDRLRLTTQ